jgi:hypothetical protein
MSSHTRNFFAVGGVLALAVGSALAQSSLTSTSDDSAAQSLGHAVQYSSSLDRPSPGGADPSDSLGGNVTQGGGQYQAGYRNPPAHDWMQKLTWEAGAGFTQPLAGAGKTVNTAWNITLGAGYNFVPKFGVLAEYSFNRFGLTDAVINEAGTDDGNTHLWSATLEPIWRYKNGGKFGGYVIGGGGFYRALTSLTNNTYGIYCDPFYGCYPVSQSYTVSHFSSNQGGANIGLGFTYKTDPSNRLALYTEARYLWIDTPGHSSEFIPVTVGLRW